jgi:hypothetical protein
LNPVLGRVGPSDAVVVAPGVVVVAVVEVVGAVAAEVPVLDADVVVAARTTMVPCMNGWIWQKYVNVPGVVNVCDAL